MQFESDGGEYILTAPSFRRGGGVEINNQSGEEKTKKLIEKRGRISICEEEK